MTKTLTDNVQGIARLATEQANERTANLDQMSTFDIVTAMNREDQTVAQAIEKALPLIALAVDLIARKLAGGGRLFYIGAGTSGRLGILDASECPPTFSTDPDLVQGLIAGGEAALVNALEGAEDDFDAGIDDLKRAGLTRHDVVVAISASGRTPVLQRACGDLQARRGGDRSGDRPGSADGFDPSEGGHRAEDGAEHALHGDDGAPWQSV